MADRIAPAELEELLAADGVTLLDVRRLADREATPAGIEGAEWRAPEDVENWGARLAREKPVVIYCVRGGSVSASVHAALQGKGVNVRLLEGGLAAWEAYRAGK